MPLEDLLWFELYHSNWYSSKRFDGSEDVSESSSEQTKPFVAQATPQSRLDQLIEIVERPARAKGCEDVSKVISSDSENFRYATLAVARLTTSNFYDEVTATFDITSDGKAIRISKQKTSVFDYGLDDLFEAVTTEFRRIYPENPNKPTKKENSTTPPPTTTSILLDMLRRFHAIVKQLKHRHSERETLIISDEYDVQDLLHAILRGLFHDDVVPEEYSPSYAGGSSRMDFLLKTEKTVLEVKMANANLRDKQVGEQLIVDIKRYRQHPDTKLLICFVYDPGGFCPRIQQVWKVILAGIMRGLR